MAPFYGNSNGYSHAGAGHTTAGAHDEDEVAKLQKRYEYALIGDGMKNDLFKDILSRYDNLVQTHKKYVEEHQHELQTAQQTNMRVKNMQQSIDHLQRLLNRDPFILVLIDGNGMIFHHNFLKKGEAGGKTAATTMGNAVFEWANSKIPDLPAETKIVVRVYANVRGVAEACTKVGILDHPRLFEEFVHGFTSVNPHMDIIDVSAAKAAVESKVTESMKLYLYNYYCRHLLLGFSHDDGYASALQDYMHDSQAKGRISLFEGVPFGEELAGLPLEQIKFPGLFRATKFVLPAPLDMHIDSRSRLGSNHSLNAASSVFTPRTNTPISSPFGSTVSLDQALPGSEHARVDSRSSNFSESNATNSWAVVTSKNAHKPVQNTMPKTSPIRAVEVQRNKYGQRIDKPLDYDRDEVQRVKKLKSCNQHYIGIGCCHYNAGKSDKCPHNHHYNLSQADRQSLRVVARETPCKKGHDCDDPKCIYGHQCPFPLQSEGSLRGSGLCLNGENCRFPASMHGMDLVPIKYTKVTGM